MTRNLILIIDDDPDQHLILGDYLQLSGYEVIHAETGEEGLRLIEQQKPALILLDIQMPGLDGFQTLREIRKKAENRNISVLFLSALDRQHIKIKGLELGADDFITKPFDRAELLARIKAVLRRSDRHGRLDGIMEGDLSDVGLADLLQSMELGFKTATISLEELDAQVFVENGELIHVRKGPFKDDDALLRIFLLEKGVFSIKFNEIPDDIPRNPRPMTNVLMYIMNSVDEIKDIIGKLSVKNKLIRINGDVTDYPAIEEIRHLTPMTFTEMIISMKGEPMENIRTLIAASKQKKLKIEK